MPNSWTSTLLGGIPILNNGIDPPQQWNLSLASRMQALDNWPGVTCKALRGFKNFPDCAECHEIRRNYPFMVKWSHPAEPGGVPSSWAIDDPTVDAGENGLGGRV